MDHAITAEELAEKIKEISIAEFFEKNRHLLGYENPTKSLLTVVKEAVDNSLDAALEARILPTVKVWVKETGQNRYKVKVEDNGPGLKPSKVPVAFGKFLVGSKFAYLKQLIGTQGIGIKGVVLYAQLTTGKPTKIITKTQKEIHEFELMIDVIKNEPIIVSHKKEKNESGKTGLTIETEVEGRYVEGQQSILNYLKLISIANPYAEIIFNSPRGKHVFKRATKKLPPLPREIKPHPYGVEIGKLKRMIMLTKHKDMISFLTKEFSSVGKGSALKICKLARIDPKTNPKNLTHKEIEKLHQAMNKVKLKAPPTNCLSPIDEESLLNGIKKEFPAQFYSVVVRKPTVYRGYPFQVEVALAYGEPLNNEQAMLLRFANHTPLLYNAGECAITKAVTKINWRNYGLSQSANSLPNAPLVILVDVISVWIPYTSEGKQAIASYPEIEKEITLALQEAGRKLGRFVSRMKRLHQLRVRKNIFQAYSIVFAEYLAKITKKSEDYIKKKVEEILNKGEVEEGKEIKKERQEVVEV